MLDRHRPLTEAEAVAQAQGNAAALAIALAQASAEAAFCGAQSSFPKIGSGFPNLFLPGRRHLRA